jgi:malate dehydrogenase (oxaloacetate-decarboxylating)(NADP+)
LKNKSNKSSSDLSFPKGIELLHNPLLNKGTAFTAKERELLQLEGLLPPHILTQEEQKIKVLASVRVQKTDLDKYIYLTSLQDRNEALFYRLVIDEIEEFMPIIYTPTVGWACQEYGHIFRRPRGLYISLNDKGCIEKILCNWPHRNVDVIVITDGERILGLGDLGAEGMGIPVGKLSLYTVCAGIHPDRTLPITIDVGTNNEELLEDPLYIGLRHKRIVGDEYDALLDEFMDAATHVFPNVLIQFEDFANQNAYRLLIKYRKHYCTFNDDIQGTAGVVLAGLLSAMRITNSSLDKQRILFCGAGSAAIGIADILGREMTNSGIDEKAARKKVYLFDSNGLVTVDREDLSEANMKYAQKADAETNFSAAVEKLKPTIVIGVSGVGGVFEEKMVRNMAKENDRPIIFSLSNPTSKSECTAEEAYSWSEGKAIFASGSPFENVRLNGKTYHPGQGNNAYVFPGVGLGVVASGATRVSDEIFLVAAHALANTVKEENLERGTVYPALAEIRDVSKRIAVAVAQEVYNSNLASQPCPDDLERHIEETMYSPHYESYID